MNNSYTITVSLSSDALGETFIFDLSLFVHNFYFHANGVTIICTHAENTHAENEATRIIDGVTYTKRTRDEITVTNAETTCTSGITDMNRPFL